MAVIRRSSPLPTPRSFEEVRARFSQPLNSDWDEGVNPSENWPTGIRSALSSSLMTGGLVPSFPMGDTQEPSFVAPTGQPTYIEPFKPPSEEQMEAMGQPERIAANVLPLALDLPFFAGMGTLAAPLGPLGAGAATLGAYSGLQAAKRQLPPGEIATEVGKGMLLGGLTAGVGKLINTPVAQRAFQNAIKAGLPVEAAQQAARAAVENPAVAIPRWFAQWGGVFGGLGPSIEAGEPTMPTPESIFGSLATGAAMHAPGIARGAARGARAAMPQARRLLAEERGNFGLRGAGDVVTDAAELEERLGIEEKRLPPSRPFDFMDISTVVSHDANARSVIQVARLDIGSLIRDLADSNWVMPLHPGPEDAPRPESQLGYTGRQFRSATTEEIHLQAEARLAKVQETLVRAGVLPVSQAPLQRLRQAQQALQRLLAEEAGGIGLPGRGESVPLYRGDSGEFAIHSLDKADPNALFGAGIYFTNSSRIARDYTAKGGEVVLRTGKMTKAQALEALVWQKAYYIDANGNPLATFAGKELPAIATDPERIARLNYARQAVQSELSTLDIRSLADGSVIIRRKGQTGKLTTVNVPKKALDATLDAEAEIPPDVIDALVGSLNRLGDRATARDLWQFATTPNEDGYLPNYRDVYTSLTADSPLISKEGQIELRRRLKDLGYTGIRYAGGATMGGAKHTAYVFWDEQGLAKLRSAAMPQARRLLAEERGGIGQPREGQLPYIRASSLFPEGLPDVEASNSLASELSLRPLGKRLKPDAIYVARKQVRDSTGQWPYEFYLGAGRYLRTEAGRGEIIGEYFPRTGDMFRLEEGHLPEAQPMAEGKDLAEQLKRFGATRAIPIRSSRQDLITPTAAAAPLADVEQARIRAERERLVAQGQQEMGVGEVGARLVKEQPDVYVLYDKGQPVGNIRLERQGRDKSGATLRWMDTEGQRREIGFVGATEESIQRLRPEDYIAKMREAEAPLPEAAPAAPTVREPWQMTQGEFAKLGERFFGTRPMEELEQIGRIVEADYRAMERQQYDDYVARGYKGFRPGLRFDIYTLENEHRAYVKLALTEGKPVPPEVMADYPDLARPEAATTPPIEPTAPTVPPRVAPAAREPWQMTAAEFNNVERSRAYGSEGEAWFGASNEAMQAAQHWTDETRRLLGNRTGQEILALGDKYGRNAEHHEVVSAALTEGKPVPPEVLADYPDLARTAHRLTAATSGGAPPREPPPVAEAMAEGPAESFRSPMTVEEAQAAPPRRPRRPRQPPSPEPPEPTGVEVPIAREMDNVIAQAREQARQDMPGAISRLAQRIPGLRQLYEGYRPALKAQRKGYPAVTEAMLSEQSAAAQVAATLMETRSPVFDVLDRAFGRDVVHGRAKTPYQLTPEQRAALDQLAQHSDRGLEYVNRDYGTDIGRFTIKPQELPAGEGTLLDVAQRNGYFLPNVDIAEDVITAIGSETRAIATGRGKTRLWQTAAERKVHTPAFEPETDVVKLIEGMDAFKSSAAAGMTYREVIGGKTRLEVMQETHPALAEKMVGLRKRVGNLRSLMRDLNEQAGDAIDEFMQSPLEDADLTGLQAALDPAVVPGRYVAKASPYIGMNTAALKAEINKAKAEIKTLQPAWKAANLKPYQFVQQGLYRYFPTEEATLIRDSLARTNNPFLRFVENWRGQSFAGDLSPLIGIQQPLGLLADPSGSLMALGGAVKKSAQTGDWARPFRASALAEDMAADPTWRTFFSLMQRRPVTTPEEFRAGLLQKIPGFATVNEAMFTSVTRAQKALWERSWRALEQSGVTEREAQVAAAAIASEVYPLLSPARLGQSQARAAWLRAVPTSISFAVQPATLMYDATRGYAKLARRVVGGPKLTPREALSVKIMTTMAASALVVSATSAAINAAMRGEDVGEAIRDAINPDPNNQRFLSIIIGDQRIPVGGPYRAIFRAIYPREVKGLPFPVPFAGLGSYLGSRIQPAFRTPLELVLNKDYYGNTIIKGNFPENILRGLEYLLESGLPLTAREIPESIRTGRKPEEAIQQTAGQFLGVNLMAAQTPYSAYSELRDKLAQQSFGKSWNNITPAQQATLSKKAELQQAETAYKAGRTGVPDVTEMLRQQREAGDVVEAKLPKNVQTEMNRLGVNVGVERSISQGTSKLPNYYLSDQLFARYQERIAYHLSGLAASTLSSATWRSAGDEANEQQLSKLMAEAKRRARIDVLKEAGGGATAQTTPPTTPTARPSFQQVRERFSQPLAPVMP